MYNLLIKINNRFCIATWLILIIVTVIIYTPYKILAKNITLKEITVTKIIDGDTIWVQNKEGNLYKIRLLGINAPEISTKPPQPFALLAKQKLVSLLSGQKIYVVYNSKEKTDKYNRILANVYREKDNLWINASLVRSGLAYIYILSPNISKLDQLIKIENIAMANKINIWGNSNYTPITPQDTIKFIGYYKVVIGTINKINVTKKNIWLEFKSSNSTTAIKYSDNLLKVSYNIVYNKRINYINKDFIFSVKIAKNKQIANRNWQELIGKTVKIRGYIQQYNKNFVPFVNLVNVHTIDILHD